MHAPEEWVEKPKTTKKTQAPPQTEGAQNKNTKKQTKETPPTEPTNNRTTPQKNPGREPPKKTKRMREKFTIRQIGYRNLSINTRLKTIKVSGRNPEEEAQKK